MQHERDIKTPLRIFHMIGEKSGLRQRIRAPISAVILLYYEENSHPHAAAAAGRPAGRSAAVRRASRAFADRQNIGPAETAALPAAAFCAAFGPRLIL
jgi:hypothetical protein